MAVVVFMRGVNVAGKKRFRPAALAGELADFDVVNVGAAGTFVVRRRVKHATLRAEILERIPFEAELMICQGRDLEKLAVGNPVADEASAKGVRRFLSVMAKRPRTVPRLPISHPAAGKWQVKVVGIQGKFALSLWQRVGKTLVYPNEVVEQSLGVPATTRNWNTVLKICDLLAE